MAFNELYVQPTGSNLNAGSTTADAASRTYVSIVAANGWNAATGVFTVATGDPAADGVAVGDFASVYVTAGATVATFVGRITARDATTITVSLTAVSGTPPATDATGATTLKVGGAWAGPATTVAFPFNFVAAAMTNVAGDTPRVNFKNSATYSITAAMSHTLAGPCRFQGYTTTVADGGRATVDGGVAGVSYILLTLSGANLDLADFIAQNNGATGTAAGIVASGTEAYLRGVVVNNVRSFGINSTGGNSQLVECEAYLCNTGNGVVTAGINCQGGALIRCTSHDNAGSNSAGFRGSGFNTWIDCISDSNGAQGFATTTTTGSVYYGCDAYFNGGDGIDLANASAAVFYVENCNLTRNGGWGINGSGAGARHGAVRNCGFGAGTQANTSGTTTGLKSMTELGSVTYATDATPYAAPTTGDFRLVLPAAQGTGRGTFTQTQAAYTGSVGYPDIGSNQHRDEGSRAIPSIGRSGVG